MSNDPFLPLFCSLLPPVPFGFLQRFCRYFGSGPTFVNKVNPVKTGQDWPRPPKTAQDILDYLYKCVPCLVTFSLTDLPPWLPKGKREEPLLILVQTTSIPASAVDHLEHLPNEVIPHRDGLERSVAPNYSRWTRLRQRSYSNGQDYQDDALYPDMEGSHGSRHRRPIHQIHRQVPRVARSIISDRDARFMSVF